MLVKVFDGLYAFIWEDYTQNNCNTYLIDSSRRILVDPGHAQLFGHVTKGLERLRISPDTIDVLVVTHGHPDHLEAVSLLRKPPKLTMSLTDYNYILELAGGYFKVPEPDFFLREGDLVIGDDRFEVIDAPGHTPGSVCLYWPEKKALFTGDVVFQQGVGRTDFPGGSGGMLKESIRRIMKLDVEYLLSGHGNIVAGAENVRQNFRIIEEQWFRYLQ
jgi:glyoxylase-like metal-dependent hydrolase (beta-lactamase superfamily II)